MMKTLIFRPSLRSITNQGARADVPPSMRILEIGRCLTLAGGRHEASRGGRRIYT